VDIVTLGELLVDMFPAELGRRLHDVSAFYPKPGGAPANVAVAAARLGARSAFIGKVGKDAFGLHLADVLSREGVDVRGMRFDLDVRTTLAFIAQPDEDTSEFVFYRNPGADMMLQVSELDRALLQETKAFHMGSISLIEEPSRSATLEALALAREEGALISFDVNYRPSLWTDAAAARERIGATVPMVDLVKVNDVELDLLTGEGDLERASKALLRKGPAACVVTLGQRGSYYRVVDGGAWVAPFEVDTVDATGCGDAFVAGLLCQLVVEGDWRERLSAATMGKIVRYANAVGALTALTRGVIPALPTSRRVEAFLQEQE
jgi:fructokinase